MLSEEIQINNFNKVGNTPSTWEWYAENLLLSSKHLYDEHFKVDLKKIEKGETPSGEGTRLFGVIQMLRAMALECLLKALWLKGRGILADGGKYKKIPGTNDHNLISLSKKVPEKFNLNITSDEEYLLKRLSLSITGGRYPIQKKWEITKIQALHGGGKGPPTYWQIPKDEDLFVTLISRLKNIIEE